MKPSVGRSSFSIQHRRAFPWTQRRSSILSCATREFGIPTQPKSRCQALPSIRGLETIAKGDSRWGSTLSIRTQQQVFTLSAVACCACASNTRIGTFPTWSPSLSPSHACCSSSVACSIGYHSWLPPPSSPQKSAAKDISSFVGAALFQIGAISLLFEACSENRTGCFGWALYHALEDSCQYQRQQRRKPNPVKQQLPAPHQPSPPERQWTWCPTWRELRTHYFHEIGFVASITMFAGATIFYVCGICALPWLHNNRTIEGVYYMTYLVGGVIFIIPRSCICWRPSQLGTPQRRICLDGMLGCGTWLGL
ncbi:hypothetical protein N7451_012483 [Penicillium sp. IBT 35674x]|nr:hypothetical protein N7451_012483 [Penicillium sp. IBT 35674x]